MWRPNAGMLAHIAAVADVRLHVLDRHPAAEWVCERELHRELAIEPGGRQRHRPDGLVVIAGREVAVEVELTLKRQVRIEQIMAELVARYGSVTYFAASAPQRALATARATPAAAESRSSISRRSRHENAGTNLWRLRGRSRAVARVQDRSGPA